MASPGFSSGGHLDATGDREVVYCHACANEWYRDEHGLICPNCQGEITEIVSPDNDPRQLHHTISSGSSPELHPGRNHDDDSDPEVPDIEEHLRGEHGFIYNRDTRQGPNRTHHNPGMEPVFQRFLDMINGFGPPGTGGPPLSARHPHTPNPNDDLEGSDNLSPLHPYPQQQPQQPQQQQQQQQQQHPPDNFPEPLRIHMTTVRRGVFGRGNTSVTIVTGPARPRGNAAPMHAGADPFQEIFSNVLGDIGPPGGDNDHPGGPPGTFLRSLHEIIGLLNPANAMAGDAVYSQEALDRIISNLMEANPQSNAAPPASEEALAKLERRPVSKDMLSHESKTDCSICIDDIKEGDMALFLPCKHWFHEDCVVLWLKEHNTCPICRTPIEKNEHQYGQGGGDGPASDNSPNNSRGGDQPGAGAAGPSQAGPSRWFTVGFGGPPGGDAAAGESTNLPHGDLGLHPSTSTRPPSYRNSRLNEAIRNVTSTQGRQRERDREQGSSSSVGYDTSRLQRRNSMSPTSPRQAAPGDGGSRVRQRSPSQSSTRWAASDQAESNQPSQRQSGRGPLSWIRDRLPGGGGSNNGSSGNGDQS